VSASLPSLRAAAMDRGRDPSWRGPSPPASRYREDPYDAPRDDHPRRGYGSPDRRGGGAGGAGRRGGYDGGRGGYDGGRGGYDGGRGGSSPPSRYRDDPYDGGRERRHRDDRYESGGREDYGASRRDYDRSRYDDRGGGAGAGTGPPGRYRDDYAGPRRGYDGNRRGGYDDRGGGGGGGRGMAMSDRPRRPPPDISDLYSLLVLNVTFRTRSAELRPLFQKYGEVRDCYIPRSRDTGDSRGFAFVRYSKREEAEAAIEHVNNAVVDGREIIVQFAKFGRQDAVNQAAAMGVPAAEVETTYVWNAYQALFWDVLASFRSVPCVAWLKVMALHQFLLARLVHAALAHLRRRCSD